MVVDEGAALTLTDSTVTGNSAPMVAGKGGLGGGITDYGALTVRGCIVSDNHALGTFGGGIAVFSGAPFSVPFSATLTVRDSLVCGNTARQNGGGITGVSSTLVVRDSTLSGNATDLFDGGGVNLHGGTLTMTGCTLSGNRAAENGGGAFISTALEGGVVIPATATLRDCTVIGNSADSPVKFGFRSGGGIFNAGTMTVSGGSVSCNSVNSAAGLGFGGGITNTGTMTVSDGCTLSGNTAASDGGAIFTAGYLTIHHSTLDGNSAGDSGGAIFGAAFFDDSQLTVITPARK